MESDVTQSVGFYKALAWLETNKKQVVYGVGAAIFIGIVVYFILWRQEEKRIEAGVALSKAFVPEAVGPAGRSQDPQTFLKVASDYAGTKVAGQAILLGAGELFVQGKFAEAQTQFERVSREYPDSALVGAAQLGYAAALESQGKTNEAVAAYKNLVDRRPADSVIPQAKFSLARLYEAQGKFDQAASLYEDVARNNPFGSLGSEAGMRHEEILMKHPELAPAPPTPAVTPMAAPALNLATNAPTAPASKK
jgi:tetratricopeptide (TPR) repeat protein